MIFHYRCRKCRTRHTLKKRLEDYVRIKKCKSCGSEKFSPDRHRDKKENKNPCVCHGYWFPHRKGSKWCIYNTTEKKDEDFQERSFLMINRLSN